MREPIRSVTICALFLGWICAGCGSESHDSDIAPPGDEPRAIATLDVSAFTESRGLAWDGSHLWALGRDARDKTFKIYRLTTSGQVVKAVPAPLEDPSHAPAGLGWDGAYLWSADRQARRLYKATSEGRIVASIALSAPLDVTGVGWDGSNVWVASSRSHEIFKLNSSGVVALSMRSPGGFPAGLAFVANSIWNADSQNVIYRMDLSGVRTGIIEMGGGACGDLAAHMMPSGVAWDGTHLWSSTQDSIRMYKLDLGALGPAK